MNEQTAIGIQNKTQKMKAQLVPGDRVMVKLPSTGKLSKQLYGPYRVTSVDLRGSFIAVEENGNKIVNLLASHARRIVEEKSSAKRSTHYEPKPEIQERQTRGAKVD